MQMSFGNGGWCLVDADIGLPGRLYVRITGVDGQPRLTELYIDGRGERDQSARSAVATARRD